MFSTDIINEHFVKNYETYKTELKKLHKKYGNKLLKSPAFLCHCMHVST